MVGLPRYRFAIKRWRRPVFITIFVMLAIETALTVPALALTGIADPDTYRDTLWHDGYMNGFNSDPSTILYAYANYKPVSTPLVWSYTITKYNLVIVVLSMFMLLCETCMIFVHVLYPIVTFCVNLLKVGLFAFSVYGQTAPDTIDPQHENHGPPWYIKYSCSVSFYPADIGYCKQAKALFYVTVLMLALFGFHVLIAAYAMLFAPEADPDADLISPTGNGKEPEEERQWEMVRIPETPGTTGGLKSPMSPISPRTRAFNELDGGGTNLPLREKYAPFVYNGYNSQ